MVDLKVVGYRSTFDKYLYNMHLLFNWAFDKSLWIYIMSPFNDTVFSSEFTDQGSLTVFPSWATEHRNKSYGGFIDAVCDKAFVVPCWIFLLSSVSGTGILRFVQNKTLFWLILAEIASGCVRFRAFYTAGGIPAPAMKGLDFSTSAVKADQ